MNEMLRKRMSATQQASEQQASDAAYEQISQMPVPQNEPKKLNLACADLIADYDEAAQTAFIEICQIDGYALNKQTMAFIQAQCPPPAADQQAIYAAWREARAKEAQRAAAPPKKLSFDRKQFAPYLSKFKSDKEIEDLFLEFLRQRAG